MKKLFRALLALVVLVAGLGAGGTVWFKSRARAAMPMLEGKITHASLKGEVTVKRDNWGIPHIYAQNETDAYFALGYCQAQDRLFQMELMRRLAQGELAELFGPIMVPRIDAIARSFRLLPKAKEHEAKHKGKHPVIEANGQAYVDGINHFQETATLPIEFAVLGIPKHEFTTADCLSVAAILPIAFADGLREDPTQTMTQRRNPGLDTFPFFPGETKDPAPVTVMEGLEEARALLHGTPAGASPKDVEVPTPVSALQPLMDTLSLLPKHIGFGMGSNSWVVSGERSESGKPLLANDPHIPFPNPSIWYEAQIECPDFEMYGYYLPLIPMTLIGHNKHHGWALTMLANDDVDLFEEKFDPANPNKVMYKGEWKEVRTEEQTIKVRFGRDVVSHLRITDHGPIITDLLRLLQHYDGPDVSLSWVWQHLDYTDLDGFYKMARAKSIEEFEAGAALITSPGLNISYADVDGNIGWWAAGRLPIRRPDLNAKALLDGSTGKDEVQGYLPFSENPRRVNPEEGFIVTANNWSTVKPLGPNGEIPVMLGYFQPLDRAGRLEQMLAEKPLWNLEDMKRMQYDDFLYTGEEMRGIVLAVLDAKADTLSTQEKEALEVFRKWDLRHDIESVGATLYWTVYEAIMHGLAKDEIGEDNMLVYGSLADSFNAFKFNMRDPALHTWDNVSTPEKETQADILLAAWKETVATLGKEYGAAVDGWTWGKAHTMTFTHPLGYLPLFKFMNIGPIPSTGSKEVVNNMLYEGSGPHFKVAAGPSTRRVIDFAAPDKSYSILPTGNSGHYLSPHYADQAEMFMTGKYRELNFTREQVDANTEHTLTFAKN